MNTSPPRSARRLLISLALACLVAFACTSTASATVYCVHDPECPAGGVGKAAFNEAVKAANEDVAADSVRIGPGTFQSPKVSVSEPLKIVGAGMDATTLEDTGGSESFLFVFDGASSVSDLTVRLTADNQYGIYLAHGADTERVRVEAPHGLLGTSGILAEDPSEIRSVVVDLGPNMLRCAISDLGEGATIEGATLTAGLGICPTLHGGTIARRVTIHANSGLYMSGGVLNIADALITPYPDSTHSVANVGAEVTGGNAGENALLNIADSTIVGPGMQYAADGIEARSNQSVGAGTVTVNAQGLLITGAYHSIYRRGKSATQTADVNLSYSAYEASRVDDEGGYGSITPGAGNLTGQLDPGFVDPAAGDYRPSFDSPLLDKGPPVEPLSNDDPDLSGRSRVRDSDGNGSAVRDIGAYEYQRLAPSASFTVSPQSPGIGESVVFEPMTLDPIDSDGDPVSYSWLFGDGGGASGSSVSHAYAAAGSYTASLTATDATGLSASTSQTVTAVPPAPLLSGLSESVRRWVTGTSGTKFAFDLNAPAAVHIAFTRRAGGRRVGGRCVRRTRRNARRPSCGRTVPAGAMDLPGRAGRDEVRFAGRIPGGGTLKPGGYVATFTATDHLGRHSSPRSLSFKILQRRRMQR